MSRVLVLGSQGMLGHVVRDAFIKNGDDVMGIALEAADGIYNIDVTTSDLDRFLRINNFDVIVNCIGVLNQFAEQRPDKAVYINSHLPHKLEELYKDSGTKIIQPSTDCVFAGNNAPYKETDIPDGLSYYDRTKALGELRNSKDLTFRMSIIGPELNPDGIGLFNWFMKQKGRVKGYTNAIWTGVTTTELANGILQAVYQDLSGLYHFVPEFNISKYDMLKLFAEIFNKKNVEIIPADEPVLDKSLINTRTDFDYHIPDYKTMFEQMRNYIIQNKDRYPAYYTASL